VVAVGDAGAGGAVAATETAAAGGEAPSDSGAEEG
jgi:hypothetical protein